LTPERQFNQGAGVSDLPLSAHSRFASFFHP